MIQNHPEWEGFILGPSQGLAERRERYDEIREAWQEQIGPRQQRAMVLQLLVESIGVCGAELFPKKRNIGSSAMVRCSNSTARIGSRIAKNIAALSVWAVFGS